MFLSGQVQKNRLLPGDYQGHQGQNTPRDD